MPFLSLRLPMIRSESDAAFVIAAGSCRSPCRFCACDMVCSVFKVRVVIADYEGIIVFCGFLRNTVLRDILYRVSVYLESMMSEMQ